MNKLKILFLVGGANRSFGGHKLSALTIAKYCHNRGHEVGFLLAPVSSITPDLEHRGFQTHFIPCRGGWRSFITRPIDILCLVKQYQYDVVVAMDWRAGLYAGWAAFWKKILVIQVIAGGEGPQSPPLDLPGLIVFSEELMGIIPRKFGFKPENMILSPGRIDYAAYRNIPEEIRNDSLAFKPNAPRILTVSRLNFNKAPAISALLKQVGKVAESKSIQCVIVGDGEARQELEKEANSIMKNTGSRAEIRFLGKFRVDIGHLQQADLVVGQGRTVLEVIASHVPAAVCGNDGYFGLITPDTLPALASSNLTGRHLQPFTDLLEDIENLEYYKKNQMDDVYNMTYQMYDASLGALSVEKAAEMLYTYYHDGKVGRPQILWIWVKAYYFCLMSLIKRKLRRTGISDNEV